MADKPDTRIRKRHQPSGGKRTRRSKAEASGDAKPSRPSAVERTSDEEAPVAESGRMRLQKILASAGMASRRGAEDYLRTGRVTVNGEPAKLGDSADPLLDDIAVDGELLRAEKPAYWVAHKPTGMLTTLRDPEGRPTVSELLPSGSTRLFPVGRLDLDTSGLVLLTNDGPMAHLLLHPSHGNEREYRVTVRGELLPQHSERLQKGVRLEDGVTSPAKVSGIRYDSDRDITVFSLTLREGRKRQIRRSMLVLRHPVKRLVRVRFGPLKLGSLPRGAVRRLSLAEVQELREHCDSLTPAPRRRPRR